MLRKQRRHIGAAFFVGWVGMYASTPVHAHDWYPIECCSGMDCAPVEHAQITGKSVNLLGSSAHADEVTLTVTSKHGTGIVPSSMTRRESKDHRMHVCMRPVKDGEMRVICIFFPPSM